MTGYGKAECTIANNKYTVEIRSVNGKNADISIKSSLIPRSHEMELRQYIAQELGRGNIDLFVTLSKDTSTAGKVINSDLLGEYYKQIKEALVQSNISVSDEAMLPTILKMPDVVAQQQDAADLLEENWDTLFTCIKEAVTHLNEYRIKEGESLHRDILSQVDKIESYVAEIEKYEKERIGSVREKILTKIKEIGAQPDEGRLEQEIIFYIEKLDINEEKVRLRQHCKYFRETFENEEMPGKKIGFIAQEMGREINTTGSKANHAEIQKWVVKMKDELEKIKEQSLNVL